ncbi:DUF1223 domain-containing protein [soil metagenome]
MHWPASLVTLGCALGVSILVISYAYRPGRVMADGPRAAGGVAVVELFTSEGCSSCPPADDLLGELARDAREHGAAVYPIAFHIDYWDRLGWKDPFSSAASTQRQQAYARVLGSQMYTPQMIVNGRTEFVGSDSGRAKKEIEAALADQAAALVTVHASRQSDTAIAIDFAVEHAPADAVLNLVAAEGSLTVKVPRGENGGRTLHHENVARAMETVPLKTGATGKIVLTVPAGMDDRNVAVIGFVQDQNMKIIGAGSTELGKKMP